MEPYVRGHIDGQQGIRPAMTADSAYMRGHNKGLSEKVAMDSKNQPFFLPFVRGQLLQQTEEQQMGEDAEEAKRKPPYTYRLTSYGMNSPPNRPGWITLRRSDGREVWVPKKRFDENQTTKSFNWVK